MLDNEILEVWREAINMINKINKKVEELKNERN